MKPTVSVMITSTSRGNLRRLLDGSSVANGMSAVSTWLLVRVLSRVDFPVFV